MCILIGVAGAIEPELLPGTIESGLAWNQIGATPGVRLWIGFAPAEPVGCALAADPEDDHHDAQQQRETTGEIGYAPGDGVYDADGADRFRLADTVELT